jgi:hypothetical protein
MSLKDIPSPDNFIHVFSGRLELLAVRFCPSQVQTFLSYIVQHPLSGVLLPLSSSLLWIIVVTLLPFSLLGRSAMKGRVVLASMG